ncbi:sensor domain-containing diguanylate cyclase [Thalassotalea sediminis]|uniref:sensor domain-containing diguanylate cyclase n=1 Tax=Thalassotalea sediminis TaxID=1759089 RepID=UPI002573D569|nr:sensor domain-containing diguanylate cyclase [Thalassotalea sediminis]
MASLKVDLTSPIHVFMKDILHEAQQVLNVSRITVWLLKPKKLVCVANTDWHQSEVPSELPILLKQDYPAYFDAIKFGEAIIANNATTDQRTLEFNETYLKPQNIKSMLDTIIFENGFPAGVVCCEQTKRLRKWKKHEVHFAEVLADCCSYRFKAKEQAALEDKLTNMAFLDDLTQTYNRRFFFNSIDKVISLHSRVKAPLAIAMLDLDNFKAINDNLGHDGGDKVLKHFSTLTKHTIRTEDLFCRFGGEEFIVVFQHKTARQAYIVIERLRTMLKEQPVIIDNHEFPFSFSAGICQVMLKQPINESIKKADIALYKAKNNGKCLTEVLTDSE